MFIKGVIIAARWNQEGKVTVVAISGRDEIEYRVERRGKGWELMRHISEEVSVDGEVRGRDGKRSIRIWDYDLLSEQ
jgi:hypothetical protein